MIAWPAAPYIAWARARPPATYDLAASDLLPVTLDEWPAPADRQHPPATEAALAEAIAAHYGVEAAQVVTAVGSSGANFLAMATLLRPGDAVVVEDPVYSPLPTAARLFGAEVVSVQRRAEDGYALDPDALARAVTPRTRLIVLTRPHNPTGHVIDAATLEAIGDMADRARIHVLVDEVYLDTHAGGSLQPAARGGDRFISTSSLTKAYGLVDLRCGWAITSSAVAARMRAARAVIAPARPPRAIALRAFADLAALADRARRIVAGNRARLEQALRDRADLAWTTPAGGTVAFPRLSQVADVDRFVDRLLVERHTAVVPGRFFGHPQHVRIAFGMAADELRAGLDAFTAALDAAASLETLTR